jgi:hypothetical protein
MSRTARIGLARKYREPLLDTGSTPRKQGKPRPKARKNSDFAVLDFGSARIVNGAGVGRFEAFAAATFQPDDLGP